MPAPTPAATLVRMTLAGLLALAILVMRLFPKTPASCWLHRHLVELPLEWSERVERRHFWFALICVMAALSATVALPASELALAAAWDLSLYVDAVAIASAAALLSRGRIIFGAVRARFALCRRPRRLGTASRARRRPARAGKPPNNDNEDGRAASPLRRAA